MLKQNIYHDIDEQNIIVFAINFHINLKAFLKDKSIEHRFVKQKDLKYRNNH